LVQRGAAYVIIKPFLVADLANILRLLAEALELSPHERVLEIGAGSGYAAAVLSRIAKEVFTIDGIENWRRPPGKDVGRQSGSFVRFTFLADKNQLRNMSGEIRWAHQTAGTPTKPLQ
jgi:hypothetical protein